MRNKLFLTFLFAGLIVPILAFGQIDDTNPSGTGNSELVFNRLGCNSWTINLNAATVQTLFGPTHPINTDPDNAWFKIYHSRNTFGVWQLLGSYRGVNTTWTESNVPVGYYTYQIIYYGNGAAPGDAEFIFGGEVQPDIATCATINVTERDTNGNPKNGGTWTISPGSYQSSSNQVLPYYNGTVYTLNSDSRPAGCTLASISNSVTGSGSSMTIFPGNNESFTISYTCVGPLSTEAFLDGRPAGSGSYSDGPITISPGSYIDLTWTSGNADSCTASNDGSVSNWNGSKTPVASGTQTNVGPANTNTKFTLTCTNSSTGGSDSDDFIANVNLPAPNLSATTGSCGGQINLSWNSVAGATGYKIYRSGVFLTQITGTIYTDTGLTSGTSYSYFVRATNGTIDSANSNTDSATASAACPVGQSPVVTITANPASGEVNVINSLLSWSVTNSPTSCAASGDWTGAKSFPTGSQQTGVLNQVRIYNYTLSCSNTSGTGSATAQVNVTSAPPPAGDWGITLSGRESGTSNAYGPGPITMQAGGALDLQWSPLGSPPPAHTCWGFRSPGGGWASFVGSTGSQLNVGRPITQDTRFYVTCSNNEDGTDSVESNSVRVLVQAAPPTLSVDLTTSTDSLNWQNSLSGTAPLNNTDLKGDVSGTAAGTINYTFYCNRADSGTNVTSPWDAKFDNVSNVSQTVANLCNYSSAGSYTAKVIAQRGSLSAEDRVTVSVSAGNSAPSASNLNYAAGNQCVAPLQPTFSWTYSDPEGTPQSSYQIQVDDSSGFGSPAVDSGQVNSGSNSYAVPPGRLSFDEDYYWRVRVWDGSGLVSSWANGPNFTTQRHAAPSPNFTWSPANPIVNQNTNFTDQTTFYGGASGQNWNWTFTNGNPGQSSSRNPNNVRFTSAGQKPVSLTVTDNDSLTCSATLNVNVSTSVPQFEEVIP